MSPEELQAVRNKEAAESIKLLYEEAERITGMSTSQRVEAAFKKRMVTPLFYPGQKVVCINDEFTILLVQDPSIVVPAEGTVYTVRKNFQFLHDVGIALQEISNAHALPPGRKLEPNFSQSRFRAVQPAEVEKLTEVLEEAA